MGVNVTILLEIGALKEKIGNYWIERESKEEDIKELITHLESFLRMLLTSQKDITIKISFND